MLTFWKFHLNSSDSVVSGISNLMAICETALQEEIFLLRTFEYLSSILPLENSTVEDFRPRLMENKSYKSC